MPSESRPETVASMVAEYLTSQNVARVYGLSGGHIQPMWDAVSRAGIEIVDVRHEASAVYMAQAESALTGRLGVAMVTAGPGLTNAITAVANASVSSTPVLVLSGRAPRPQAGMGAMQDLPQDALVRPLCQRVESVSERRHVLARLDAVVAAAFGVDGPSGPAYVDFPVDLLDETVSSADRLPAALAPRQPHAVCPTEEDLAYARTFIAQAHRPLVIAGKLPTDATSTVAEFLDALGGLYLDTADSRGLVHPSAYVPAMRARAMQEADLVITLGRRLDFQLGYGSPAVFSPTARMLRIGRSFAETGENRPGDVEIHADLAKTLPALTGSTAPDELDHAWVESLQTGNADREAKLSQTLAEPPTGADGRMHPYQLIAAINAHLTEQSVVVADGGDILSFARVGLASARYLDCGALGCLGVGVPFATAAALNYPNQTTMALIGDGSIGFTAIDINTAVRHRAPALFVIANNEAWNIERQDQAERYRNVVGVDLPHCRYDLLARGLGAYAERIEQPDQLDAAIKRGLDNAPAVLDVQVTRDALSPDFRSGLASVPSHHALRPWHDAELARAEANERANASSTTPPPQ